MTRTAALALALIGLATARAVDPLPPPSATLGDASWRHPAQLRALAFSPDSRFLLSSGFDRTLRVWNVTTGKERRRITGLPDTAAEVAFSPDGRTIFSADKETVRLWEVSTGLERARAGDPSVWLRPVVFSPDGRVAASRQNGPGDHRVRLTSIETGQLLHLLEGHTAGAGVMAFSRDGKLLATGGADATIRVWDVAAGKPLVKWGGHDRFVRALVFSPDGKRLASFGGENSVRVWDVPGGKPLAGRPCFVGFGNPMAFSRDSKLLATADSGGTVELWDFAADKVVRRWRAAEIGVHALAFSPDGKVLATGPREGPIRLWDAKTGAALRPPPGGHRQAVTGITWHPSGKGLATFSTDDTVRLWALEGGKELRAFAGLDTRGQAASLSPDGKYLAALTRERRSAVVWDAASGKKVWERAAEGRARQWGMAFAPNSKTLAVSGEDGPVRLHDVVARKEVAALNGPKVAALAVAFSPDGRFLACVANQMPGPTLFLWDLTAGGPPRTMTSRALHFARMAFTPDGRVLVMTGQSGGLLLFETATGQLRLAPPGHRNGTHALAISPDGRYLATGGADQTFIVWDLTVVEPLTHRAHGGEVTALGWRPDGQALAVGALDGLVRVWERDALVRPRDVKVKKLSAATLDRLWADLGLFDGGKSFAAMRNLSLHHEQALLLLRARAPLLVPLADIERWIGELDSDEPEVRERASALLEKQRWAAEGPLRKALERKISVEQRRRIQDLLKKLEADRAPAKGPAEAKLRAARAVELLERLATPAAQKLLGEWAAARPELLVTPAAKAAARRLGRPGG